MIVPPGSTIGIIGGGQLGRMLAIAAAQLGYRCHIFDPHERSAAADVAAAFTRAPMTTTRRCAAVRGERRCRDLRVREYPGRSARDASATSFVPSTRVAGRSRRTGAREKRSSSAAAARPRRWREVDASTTSTRRSPKSALPPSSRPAATAMTARARRGSAAPARLDAAWAAIGERARRRRGSGSPSTPNSRSSLCALGRRPARVLGSAAERA